MLVDAVTSANSHKDGGCPGHVLVAVMREGGNTDGIPQHPHLHTQHHQTRPKQNLSQFSLLPVWALLGCGCCLMWGVGVLWAAAPCRWKLLNEPTYPKPKRQTLKNVPKP